MRARMDPADSETASAMPQLQADEVGYTGGTEDGKTSKDRSVKAGNILTARISHAGRRPILHVRAWTRDTGMRSP